MTVKKRIFRILECILLVILFVMFIFPFYWTLITSVKDLYEAVAYPPTFWPSSIHFENYADAWRYADFAYFGKNSIFMSTCATAILMVSCTMAAYGFARFEFKGKRWLFYLMMADIVIPAQVIFLPIFVMYSRYSPCRSCSKQDLKQAHSSPVKTPLPQRRTALLPLLRKRISLSPPLRTNTRCHLHPPMKSPVRKMPAAHGAPSSRILQKSSRSIKKNRRSDNFETNES